MDFDDAIPPPIRRAPHQTPGLQSALGRLRLEDDDFEDDDSDTVAPPPIRRRRPASVGSTTSSSFSRPPSFSNPSAPPLPSKSPFRQRSEPPKPPRDARNYSHPFKDQFRTPKPIPYRDPRKSISYRKNPRLPLSLRRWSSLETIESVASTPSVYDEPIQDQPIYPQDEEESASDAPNYPSAATSSRPSLSLERTESSSAEYSTPSELSWTHSSDASSSRSTSTPTQPDSSQRRLADAMLRKLKPGKAPEPLLLPEHLEIQKRVSFDQQSHRTSSSSSIMTISSGRPSELGYPSSEVTVGSTSLKSLSSKDWKSSSYDTSSLTEAELKKCKKKGINPALYAEMKAARKGRYVSPIGGNTIL